MEKELNESKKLYIGLDIGTESVGFALTDENYNVIMHKGKPCMGVRLFDEAKTASERRVLRGAKVRQGRGKFRITLLQGLFESEILKVDPLFFIRMTASGLWQEDKIQKNLGLNTADSLFADNGYKDKAYFANFKTAYHLRWHLLNDSSWAERKPDIRLVYLACHHILKSRGHFLYDADEFKISEAGCDLFKKLNSYLIKENDESDNQKPSISTFKTDSFNEVENLAKDKKLKYKLKLEKLTAVLLGEKDKRLEAMIKSMLGKDFKLSDILDDYQDEENKKFSFNSDWEVLAPELAELAGESFQLIETLKEIYDWFVLEALLGGKQSISEAMIEKHNQHQSQLKALKQLVKDKAKDKYFKIFRSNKEKANYASYIDSNLVGGKEIMNHDNKQCTAEAFYDFLKKELKDLLTEDILADMENGQYLAKLRTKANASVPYQLHKAEMAKILNNAVKHYEIDKDKALSLISFRVPYYVGRLNTHNSENRPVWAEKTAKFIGERTKIAPWNFKEIIDEDKSAEKFIYRMLSKCSRLINETVLPKNSLTYSKFCVLNELNKLKINSAPISVEEKQDIYNKLFLKEKKVTVNKLIGCLGNQITKNDISGFDKDGGGFTSSLAPHIQFLNIFGLNSNEESEAVMESVILWHALFSDKKQVERKIRAEYPNLTNDKVLNLKGLNFSGFGNLSRKFLTEESVVIKSKGEFTSILNILWETNQNLMEIIHNPDYNIAEWLSTENFKDNEAIGYDQVGRSYCAPSVKRSAWQAMLVVDELIKLNGGKKPDKIFIEVTRENLPETKKKRTNSREKQLSELWAKCKDNKSEIAKLKQELAEKSNKQLRAEKLYLYFLQFGKCAYSGDSINISEINNENLWDIDHIIPRALKKDDSLTNKVLVRQVLNKFKDKNYPLNKTSQIHANISKTLPMWEGWLKAGSISEEKFNRLKRTTELSTKDLEGFIARSLVFTGQATTVVADLLEQKYKEEGSNSKKVVYSKAENVSDFRKQFEILKCRDINDLHHAHDAYLNIVVGNAWHTRFSWNKTIWARKYGQEGADWRAYSTNNMFKYDIQGAWVADETINTVRKSLSYSYLPVSKKTGENKGELYKQTVFPAVAKQKEILDGRKKQCDLEVESSLIARKGLAVNPLSNVAKYGGYKGERPAYFMIVEYTEKGKPLRVFDAISILDKKRWEKLQDKEREDELCTKYKASVKIIAPKILIGTLFEIGDIQARLSGRSGSMVLFNNAKQLYLGSESVSYIRTIAKYNEMVKARKIDPSKFEEKKDITVASGEKRDSKTQKLTAGDNLKLWNVLLNKIDKLYGEKTKDLQGKNIGLPDILRKVQGKGYEFSLLSVSGQAEVLTSIIRGLGCNPNAFNFSKIGLGASVGNICPNFKIAYPLTLVKQSVTGLLERRIKIYPFNQEE
ncbi:MAG: type II CRISPR RNA-guided endonuclease Cas9 [Firmicutes bacterium]|nr:type II CRISPR RNA-guided endonuclease Cas9 [Bacillota bacterium]